MILISLSILMKTCPLLGQKVFFLFPWQLYIYKEIKYKYSLKEKFLLIVVVVCVGLIEYFVCYPLWHQVASFVKISILIGLLALWFNYGKLFSFLSKKKLFAFTSYSFFLYVFHEPFLSFLEKTLMKFVGITDLYCYVLASTLTIFISIIVGYFLKKKASRFYSFLTGGR